MVRVYRNGKRPKLFQFEHLPDRHIARIKRSLDAMQPDVELMDVIEVTYYPQYTQAPWRKD